MRTNVVVSEVLKTFRRPSRIRALFDPNGRYLLAMRMRGIQKRFTGGDTKGGSAQSGLVRREYDSYDTYLWHQRSKLEMLQSGGKLGLDGTNLETYDRVFREQLRGRIETLGGVNRGMTVLCLGARLGTEVKAFIDCGCFAVGIDLNPGTENSYVMTGDFHKLVFADESVDIVFSNALDHAFDLSKLLQEARRVLKRGGRFIADVQLGNAESQRQAAGTWESLSWESSNVITSAFTEAGFTIDKTLPFNYPWPGNCFMAVRH